MQFRGEYWFLSNMYPCRVALTLGGSRREFRSAEAAFQASKCPGRAAEFETLDGFAAKRLGRRVGLRPDWEAVKLGVMRDVVRRKFAQNPGLMDRLRAVRDDIVEENTWGDRYWGVCGGTGENHLGRLLTELRDGAG